MKVHEKELARLLDAARSASENAYAPYSRFRVGAAVLTQSGEIFTGCNVENASYGMTMCAERTAIFKAVSSGFLKITALAVHTPAHDAVFPCGACRQVLHEFGRDATVVTGGPDAQVTRTLTELLPSAFGPDSLA